MVNEWLETGHFERNPDGSIQVKGTKLKVVIFGSRSKLHSYELSRDSDLDIAVSSKYLPLMTPILKSDGWVQIVDEDYTDDDTVAVYRNYCEDGNVDISFRKNIDRLQRIWNNIPIPFYRNFLWKRSETAWPRYQVKEWFNEKYKEYDENPDL